MRSAMLCLLTLATYGMTMGRAESLLFSCETTKGRMLWGALGWPCVGGGEITKQPMKVLVAAPGRTGTSTIRDALKIMGYRGIHGTDMFADKMIANNFPLWNTDIIMEHMSDTGYNASMDLMAGSMWREYLEKSPDTKFIIAKRSSLDKWWASHIRLWDWFLPAMCNFPFMYFDSVGALVFRITQRASHQLFPGVDVPERCYGWTPKGDVNSKSPRDWLPTSWKLKDPALQKECLVGLARFYETVENTVPKDRQLVYRVTDGWGPLCKFLEVDDCPSDRGVDMPWVNKGVNVQMYYIAMLVIRGIMLCITLLLSYLLLRAVRKCTGAEKPKVE